MGIKKTIFFYSKAPRGCRCLIWILQIASLAKEP